MAASQLLLCNNGYSATQCYYTKPFISHNCQFYRKKETIFHSKSLLLPKRLITRNDTVCCAARRKSTVSDAAVSSEEGSGDTVSKVLQIILWVFEGVYILWLFLLPYAPVSIPFLGTSHDLTFYAMEIGIINYHLFQ